MKIVRGLQSEIYVTVTPKIILTPVEKPLREMKIALVTAAGVHKREDERFNFSGDKSFRIIPGDIPSEELMVSHGGYDNGDVNRDINCMFPLDRLRELKEEKIFQEVSGIHMGFMGGGGDQEKFRTETGPEIARLLKNDGIDAAILTAG